LAIRAIARVALPLVQPWLAEKKKVERISRTGIKRFIETGGFNLSD
jgi:hypothetical protein